MRDSNLTGGQEHMQEIVKTTRTIAERLNVFRVSPFEFDVTAPAIVATDVVGRPTTIDNRQTAPDGQAVESRSTMLQTVATIRHR